MSFDSIPADYFLTSHQFTKTLHRTQYPSIDPTAPKLSQEGKSVIITGATQGIGKAISIAFAKSNASRITLVGRNKEKLEATKQELLKINSSIDVIAASTDITSEEEVAHLEELLRSQSGTPDVLVNSAGLWSSAEAIRETRPSEWWGDFEVNVKGTYLMIRSFLRLIGADKEASIINVGTWGMLHIGATGSSYFISKLALARLSEAVPVAYPKVASITYHPGMTMSDMAHAHPEVIPFCGDSSDLSAGVGVYLATPGARFLSGRYMSANWDVDELEARKPEIVENNLLRIDLVGQFGIQQFQ